METRWRFISGNRIIRKVRCKGRPGRSRYVNADGAMLTVQPPLVPFVLSVVSPNYRSFGKA